jgi:hypothetical protein
MAYIADNDDADADAVLAGVLGDMAAVRAEGLGSSCTATAANHAQPWCCAAR